MSPASSWMRSRVTSSSLEAVAEPLGEKAADAEAPIEEIGGAEREREGERRFGGALVAEPPVAPRALDQRLGVAHQRLHGGGRGGAPRQRLERPASAPGCRARPAPTARRCALGQLALAPSGSRARPASSRPRRARARAVTPKDARSCSLRGPLDHLADLGVGELEHPVAQQPGRPATADRGRAAGSRARSVVPLTSSVNSTRPVASTATKRCTSGGSAGFSVTAERQHQGQRAAQAAPGDGELVGGADRLGEPREAQQRQEQEQHQRAGPRRPRRSARRSASRSCNCMSTQQLRHQDRRQHEDERMRPEGDLLPEIGEERPIVGRDARPPEGADRHAGRTAPRPPRKHGRDARPR